MQDRYQRITQAKDYVIDRLGYIPHPSVAIATGTGMSDLARTWSDVSRIPYADIPHLPVSTVESHRGELIIGRMGDRTMLQLSGRLHYYEGYTAAEVTLPVYLAHHLGCTTYLATNAAGGLDPTYRAGDLCLISDHINMQPDHPLRGPNDMRLGTRFPDMMQAYDRSIRDQLQKLSEELLIPLREGVYIGLQGPSLETPAEYNMCRLLGADLVGMSTVPEVIVASHCGMRCAVLSIVSNVCYPLDRLTETTIAEVIDTVSHRAPEVERLLLTWIERYI